LNQPLSLIPSPLPAGEGLNLIACHECDYLHHKPSLQAGETARCSRCNAVLFRARPHAVEQTFALLCAALALFWIANSFPFLAMQAQGQTREISLFSAVTALYQNDMLGLALFVFIVLLLIPLLRILGLLYVVLSIKLSCLIPAWVWRTVDGLTPWSMMEIYLLGALVALVKLADMGAIIVGVAFWAFMALVITMTWARSCMDSLWHR
jgi:paraquat-inducible protein A